MKINNKVLIIIVLLVLLPVIFLTGWLVVRLYPNLLSKLPSTGTDNTATITPTGEAVKGFTRADQQTIVNGAQTQVEKLLSAAPANPALLLDCKTADCSSAETQTYPLQWIQYANAYYNLSKNSDYDLKGILADLNTYSPKDFDWKLYQYGDLLLLKPGVFQEFEKKYLEITDSLNSLDVTEPATFKYYTAENPAPADFLNGTMYTNKFYLNIGVVNYSTRINTLANASTISKNDKYLYKAETLLNRLHGMIFFDDAISPSVPEFKAGTCSTVLSDVYLYKATKNTSYLGYINYLGQNHQFQNLYTADPTTVILAARDPMRILGCLDAMQQLSVLDSANADTYNANYDYLLGFLKNNHLMVSDAADPYYGFAKMSNGKYDVNSSAWLIKILAAKLSSAK